MPRGDPYAPPSANTTMPTSIDHSLAPSMLPGSFQALTSQFKPTALPNDPPFVYQRDNPNMIPYSDYLHDISMIPIKYLTYFLSNQATSTLKIYLSRDLFMLPIVQLSLDTINIKSPVPICEPIHITISPPGMLPSDLPPYFTRLRVS